MVKKIKWEGDDERLNDKESIGKGGVVIYAHYGRKLCPAKTGGKE